MAKFAAPLSILAVAVLAACASPGPGSPAGGQLVPIATQQTPYRAGTGAVVSVVPAPALASAGATAQRAPGAMGELHRVGIKMDDGRMQYVDTSSREVKVGDRVQLTEDRQIKKQER